MSETNSTGKKPTLSIGPGGGNSNSSAALRGGTSSNPNKKAHSGSNEGSSNTQGIASALPDGLAKPFNNNLTHKQILHILNGPAFADDQFAHLLPILRRFRPSFKIPQIDWLAGLDEEGQELVRTFCIKGRRLARADLPAGEIEFHAIQKEQMLLIWKVVELSLKLMIKIGHKDSTRTQEKTLESMVTYLRLVGHLVDIEQVAIAEIKGMPVKVDRYYDDNS